MEALVSSSEIKRLLKMQGNKRMGVRNETTSQILELCKTLDGGLRLKFFETRPNTTDTGTWTNNYILIETLKLGECNIEYLGTMLIRVGEFVKGLRKIKGIDSSGIQEVECGLPGFYYFLIYIHSDGKDKGE